MPSLAYVGRVGLRLVFERVSRTVALASLLWLIVQSFQAESSAGTQESGADSLATALARWSGSESPTRVHVRMDGDVPPVARDWLAAVAAAGTPVTWERGDAVPLASIAEPAVDPAGGTSVRVAAPQGTLLVLMDAFGTLDSVRAGLAGARLIARSAPSAVRVRAGPLVARAVVRDTLRLGRLLLLGQAGWESKFVVAALEERGWSVDADFALSPKGDVVQVPDNGRATAEPPRPVDSLRTALRAQRFHVDTARYAAVIALDSSALASADRIARYVRSGGGLIAAASIAAAPALEALRVGSLAHASEAIEPFDATAAEPRRDLALIPIVLRADAVPLEQRDSLVAVAARRVEAGRVAVIGYADTWRWRMGGGDNAVEKHRDWWADLVASVAYTGRSSRGEFVGIDEAPFAHLYDKLGAPSAGSTIPLDGRVPTQLLFALFAVGLVAELTSRRLRGAA
jgi:hypothetical protein